MNESTIFMLDAEGYVTSHSAEAERIKVWIAGDTSVQYLFFLHGAVTARLDLQYLGRKMFQIR
jgi:hypothetical protein